jgi:hypothetical protein
MQSKSAVSPAIVFISEETTGMMPTVQKQPKRLGERASQKASFRFHRDFFDPSTCLD